MLPRVIKLNKSPTSSSGLPGFQARFVQGDKITYTNNWPYYEDAGNHVSFSAVWWSGASVTVLVLIVGIILYFFYRYNLECRKPIRKETSQFLI